MRDYTNLAWPEGPFGAAQRPFGKPADMVAAFAVDWGYQPEPLPVAAATVYLRVRKHGRPLEVSGDTLSIGFRATVMEHQHEVPELVAVMDRALTRARRHALVVAGHRFAASLRRMIDGSPMPLRGAAGVLSAWEARHVRQRGMALMVDTADEAYGTGGELRLPVDPADANQGQTCADRARAVLGRCLAIGLTAAVYAGRYRLESTFPVAEVIERAGWDLLTDHDNHDTPAPTGAPPTMAVASTNANHPTGHESGE